MICPGCNRYLQQNQLIKANVKGFENIDLVYDATCPFCFERIGRMFWGRFTLRDPRKNAARGAEKSPPQSEQPPRPVYICPHCSQPLPKEVSSLQQQRTTAERRGPDRRQKEDRRETHIFWWRPERRRANRRKEERRSGQDRREGSVQPGNFPGQSETPPEYAHRNDNRKASRRQAQAPVLYDRRRPGADRRTRKNSGRVNKQI